MGTEDAYLLDFPAVPAAPNPLLRPQINSASADAVLLGIDIDVVDDLPPTFRLAGGQKNLANALARRLSTPAGALAAFGGDPEYGFDLRDKLNSSWTTEEMSALGAQIEAECRKDERVQGATVKASHNLRTSTLLVDIQIQSAAGPFALVLAVSDVSIELLRP
jgi:hypothetical protein